MDHGFLVFSGLGTLVGSNIGTEAVLVGLSRFYSRAIDEATKELARNAIARSPPKTALHQQRAGEIAPRLAGGSSVNEEISRCLARFAREEIHYLVSIW